MDFSLPIVAWKNPVRATDEEIGIDPIFKNVFMDESEFTIEQIMKAKMSLRDGKQLGLDDMSPEV